MSKTAFSHTDEQLRQVARDVLEQALKNGASAAETEVSEGFGQSVTVRRGEIETIEYNRDKGVGVTVYIGQRRGHASTSDLSAKAIRETVAAAISIAGFTAIDDAAGLANQALLAREIADFDLFHPWDVTVEQAIELARTCEASALGVDRRITNTEGASVSTQQSHFFYGNTLGFLAGYPTSRHTVMVSVIAGEGDDMQRDDWYATARASEDLDDVAQVGRIAGERCVRRLGARKIETTQVPVLFEAPIASSLLGHLVGAV
ncbi:MAG: DNA gyrase modulator, partial [Betaproteobacteria bacterium]